MPISYQLGLKNVIRFKTFIEYCSGLTQNNYIIVTKNNKILPLTSEVFGWSPEVVYIPIQFGNGTIKTLYSNYEKDEYLMNENDEYKITYKTVTYR